MPATCCGRGMAWAPRRPRIPPRWKVLTPMTLAVLDERFAAIAGRWPSVFARLLERPSHRLRGLSFQLALAGIRRAEPRLLLILSHLADRWGRATPDGVVLPLPLTHELLGHLACIRRPTATAALHTPHASRQALAACRRLLGASLARSRGRATGSTGRRCLGRLSTATNRDARGASAACSCRPAGRSLQSASSGAIRASPDISSWRLRRCAGASSSTSSSVGRTCPRRRCPPRAVPSPVPTTTWA